MAEYRRVEEDKTKFGGFAGYAYTLNSVIGAGFLSIPWAYQNGGWGISVAIQAVFLALGWALAREVVEITSRVTALAINGVQARPLSLFELLTKPFYKSQASQSPALPSAPNIINTLQFDLYGEVQLLMGKGWAVVFFLVNCFFLVCSLTAYANIFGTNLASHLPVLEDCSYSGNTVSTHCNEQYAFFLLIYFFLMAYFSVIEFHEQVWMQYTMTLIRLVVILTVILLSVLSLTLEKNLSDDQPYRSGHPNIANFSEMGRTMPILLFAGTYQNYYSSILSATRKEPRTISAIIASVAVTLLLCYPALGLTAAFGLSDLPSNVSLAFRNFTNGNSAENRPIWTYLVSYLIVLFPALDVISIFPILAHGLSDTILSVVYSADRETVRTQHRRIFYGIRLGCILPSFLYAYLQVHLGPIVDKSGLSAFFLIFFMIPLLHIAARLLVPQASRFNFNWPLVLPT